MIKKATIYRVDGTVEDVTPEKYLELKQMQKIVGGYIEMVDFPDGIVMICNEEGRINDQEENPNATKIWREKYPINKYPNNNPTNVIGDVIICTPDCLE